MWRTDGIEETPMAEMIPVYLFTGFLESGKTTFIQESMEDKKFNTGEKTLILVCEEGEVEYAIERFWAKNVYFATISSEAELTKEKLTRLSQEHILDRVIIEYNGMWSMNTLYAAMPDDWGIFQQMMFADCNTFLSYNSNMRQLMYDKMVNAELVVLNRVPSVVDREEIHKVVRGASRRAQIIYDFPDKHVEYDDIEDPLPFDLEAPVIRVADDDFAVWYRDMSEDMRKYDGKTISFKGMVSVNPSFKPGQFIIGRHVMTCCEADIQYHGLLVESKMPVTCKTKDWVVIEAKIKIEYSKIYRRKGPVLNLISLKAAEEPENRVCTFY